MTDRTAERGGIAVERTKGTLIGMAIGLAFAGWLIFWAWSTAFLPAELALGAMIGIPFVAAFTISVALDLRDRRRSAIRNLQEPK